MSTTPTAPTDTTSNPPAARPCGVRRRDLLAGAFGAVVGLSGGLAAGRGVWGGAKIPSGAKLSYSQFADDLVAKTLFDALGVEKPTYLDIGTFDPVFDNNTYAFYQAGARGVLVEPNKALTERIKAVRPGDTLLVAGIGIDDTPELDYYMLDNPGLNTFDKEQAERIARETQHKIQQVVKMPMISINRAIAENFGGKAPDFISIDIEGLDYAVLKTLDYTKYRPKIICAETLITNTFKHNPETTKLLIEKGYEVRGMTAANTIYIDKRLLPA
jgi:FkbM family methyltransferase